MTANELVRSECCNWNGGACRGADIRVDKKTGEVAYPTQELPKCLVTLGLPCSFFERLVLPDARTKSQYAGADQNYAENLWTNPESVLLGLPKIYHNHQFYGHSPAYKKPHITPQRLCDCGNPLLKGKHHCDTCRKLRRQKTHREEKKRQRTINGVRVLQKL